MANLQKPGAIAKHLGVTPMTLRNYVRQFERFLSTDATTGTNRRFTSQDVRILQKAVDLLRDGSTYEDVRAQLERLPVSGEVIDDPGEPDEPEEQRAIQPFEFFSKFVDQLREEHASTLAAKDEVITELKKDKSRLQAEIDYQRLPFFVRWFRKPPKD